MFASAFNIFNILVIVAARVFRAHLKFEMIRKSPRVMLTISIS